MSYQIRHRAVVVSCIVLLGACSSSLSTAELGTTTTTTTTATTTTTTTLAPPPPPPTAPPLQAGRAVKVGTECTVPGEVGKTVTGLGLVCADHAGIKGKVYSSGRHRWTLAL